MRLAVSGSHSTGKSTLIGRFAERRPHYVCEPEAYAVLADDITLLPSEGPDLEGLSALLDYTLAAVAEQGREDSVIFERSPVDYFAYAAATRGISEAERTQFLHGYLPAVRDALGYLERIVLVPISPDGPIVARPGENESFRERAADELRQALIDDVFGLFGDGAAPTVSELSPSPDRQLEELLRLTST